MSWTMQDISPCSVFVRAPLPPCQVKRYKCIGQIEASTSPLGILLFWKLLFKFSPIQAKMPFKCPTLGSIQVIKCPHSGDISQAHEWQKDGKHAFSCRTKYSSLRASSAVWASEANLARTHERGADTLPLAASPLAHAFSRDLFRSPK